VHALLLANRPRAVYSTNKAVQLINTQHCHILLRLEVCGTECPSSPEKARRPSLHPLSLPWPPLLAPLSARPLISTWRKSGGPFRCEVFAFTRCIKSQGVARDSLQAGLGC
jgi:hypothetical protein